MRYQKYLDKCPGGRARRKSHTSQCSPCCCLLQKMRNRHAKYTRRCHTDMQTTAEDASQTCKIHEKIPHVEHLRQNGYRLFLSLSLTLVCLSLVTLTLSLSHSCLSLTQSLSPSPSPSLSLSFFFPHSPSQDCTHKNMALAMKMPYARSMAADRRAKAAPTRARVFWSNGLLPTLSTQQWCLDAPGPSNSRQAVCTRYPLPREPQVP